MKIFFLKEHSLYKIFKTLEKIPNQKTLQIFIDPEHSFFENERWGKQIKEILESKKLDTYFITKDEKHKKFFEKIGLKVIHQQDNRILKILNIIYLFFFNIKKFHLYIYTKKNFVFYIVFAFEALFIFGILYILYILILPSVNINITPSHQVESIIYNFRYYPVTNENYPVNSRFISIPFYTGYIEYKYNMSISASHLNHIQNPSKGKIMVINKTNKEYSFIPNTRLVTTDGRLFKTLNRFKLPAGNEKVPGERMIEVKAMEKDINEIYMGARGNIPKGTNLYIKNLKSSFYLKEVYAEAIEDFTGGSLKSHGLVTQQDIALLSGKLIEYLVNQKKNIITQNFNFEKSVFLPFDQTIQMQVKEISIYNKPGENAPMLHGHIIARYNFNHVKIEDIIKGINEYMYQRPSEKVKLIKIDTNTLAFFEPITIVDGIYIISTKLNIIQGYDFEKDINNLKEDIKTRCLGKNEKKAREIVLSYPEISSTKLRIKPIRYNEIPKLKSRIKISVDLPK